MTIPDGQTAILASAERAIAIGRDALGNTILTGDGNILVIQQLRATPEPEPATPTDNSVGPNPYKGLEAFQEEDANRFFGREDLVTRLWQHFRDLHALPLPGQVRYRILPVVGPSGSGKSSLVRAGLVPELARRPLPALRSPRVAVLTPGSDPCHALGTVLARVATSDATPAAKAREFADEIRRPASSGRYDGLRRIADLLLGIEHSPLVVLVDQFEEVYALCTDESARDAFVGVLLDAASDATGRVSVVLTLRSDFLGATTRHPALNQLIAKEGVLVPAMDEAGLRRAITEPARLAGHPLDDGTVELLVRETVGREGALPLLQFVLTRIWEGLGQNPPQPPAETLRELGGVGGALAKEADRLLAELTAQGLEPIARRAFLAMVQLGEGARDTRRRARLQEVVAAGETPETVLEVLRRFARPGERLVSLAGEGDEVQVEVTHEQLIERWPTLKQWLDEGRDDLRFHRRLAEAAAEWKAGRGGLWRPPELDLLQAFRERHGTDLTADETKFADTAAKAWQQELDQKQRIQTRLRWSAGALAIALGVSAYLGWTTQQANVRLADEVVRADAEAKAARQAEAKARSRESLRVAGEASRRALEGYAAEAVRLALLALPRHLGAPDRPLIPQAEAALRLSFDRLGLVSIIDAKHEMFTAAALSPDGLSVVTGSEAGTTRIQRIDGSGMPIDLTGHDKRITSVAFSRDGLWIVTASEDGTARIWRTDGSGAPVILRGHNKEVHSASFSPDGKYIVTGSEDQTARVWRADNGLLHRIFAHQSGVNCAKFDSDGKRIVTSAGGKVQIWSADQIEKALLIFDEFHDYAKSVEFSPDGKWILVGFAYSTQIRAADGSGVSRKVGNSKESVNSAAFSPTGSQVVVAEADGLRIWQIEETKASISFLGIHSWLAAFSYDGSQIMSMNSNAVSIFRANGRSEPLVFRADDARTSVAISLDGAQVATGSQRGEVRVWRTDGMGEPLNLPNHDAAAYRVAFSRDGAKLLVSSGDGAVRIWDINKPSTPVVEHRSDSQVTSVALSHDATRIVTGDKEGNVRILSATSSGESLLIGKHKDSVRAVAFSPDGMTIASGSDDPAVHLWRTDEHTPPRVLQGHEGPVISLAFSQDGSQLVTGSGNSIYFGECCNNPAGDGTVRVWKVDGDGKAIVLPILSGEGNIVAVGFSAGGEKVLTSSDDNILRIWRADGGDPLLTLYGSEGSVSSAGFTSDGAKAVTTDHYGTVRVWRMIALDSLILEACRMVPQDLEDHRKEELFVLDEEPACASPESTAAQR